MRRSFVFVALCALATQTSCDGLLSAFDGRNSDGGVQNTRDGGVDGCLQGRLASALGTPHLLVGAQLDASLAASAHLDARYFYLAGGIFDGPSACSSCTTGCNANGVSCANGGCDWWGCWQDTSLAPGQYLRGFLSQTQTANQIPWITYYELLQASGANDGPELVAQAANVPLMTRYFADFRFMLQQLGTRRAFVHIEPDFWGYAQYANTDPHALGAAVASVNAQDCSGFENSVAGLGKCMVAMVRKYAPNAWVGLHASAWSTHIDATQNKSASLDVPGEARKTAAFLSEVGAAAGDFIAVETSDRDSGYYEVNGMNRWWDASNQTLPNFHQGLAWVAALSEALALPNVFWQTPVGNSGLNNTYRKYKDNRVDYFFAHADEWVAAHSAGVLFGAGEGQQTTPATDNGNLLSKATEYAQRGGTPICP